MEAFWKAAALPILAVILGCTIGKTEKDIAVVLSALVCCLVAGTALGYLSEVLTFFRKLGSTLGSGQSFPEPLLKIAGASVLTELISLLSADAGNASLGKAMGILGNAVILFLALPFFEAFYSIVQELLRIA